MKPQSWIKEFPGAIIVCDENGVILEMNDAAAKTFEKDGGMTLIGNSVFDCMPELACKKLKDLMEQQQTNTYTIQKNGVKKLIYQSPVFEEGKYCGFMEMSLVIPQQMPHFDRDAGNA
jgi:sensor histidine kinase regulating citrate/malate metabolism